jgi:hypothetical protein
MERRTIGEDARLQVDSSPDYARRLTAEQVAKLDAAVPPDAAAGDRYSAGGLAAVNT